MSKLINETATRKSFIGNIIQGLIVVEVAN